MVSVIAHEFGEAVLDPIGTSRYDQAGFENADKCAWNYGKAPIVYVVAATLVVVSVIPIYLS